MVGSQMRGMTFVFKHGFKIVVKGMAMRSSLSGPADLFVSILLVRIV